MAYDKKLAPYFDASKMPHASNEYVIWLDVMGIQANLSQSLSVSANFVFKLHAVALAARETNMTLYPVMDGVYATTKDRSEALGFLTAAFTALAAVFVHEKNNRHRFLVKAALAYGPVLHGSQVPKAACHVLDANPGHRDAILLGMPMIQAYTSERLAAPFGVFVHESARAFAPVGVGSIHQVWWHWYQSGKDAQHLAAELEKFFTWCALRPNSLLYGADRIEAHRRQAAEYFVDA